LLENNFQIGLAYCQSMRVDENGNCLGTMENWTVDLDDQRWKTGYVNEGRLECKNYLLWKNTIPNASAVLFRRKIYLLAGGAPSEMRMSGDWMAWVRMLLISDVAFSPECLNCFRRHTSSVAATTKTCQHNKEKWEVKRFILRHCKISYQERRRLANQALNDLLEQVRSALPDERRKETSRALALLWPHLIMAPITVVKSFLRRHHKPNAHS
jgi:hypothetical protein